MSADLFFELLQDTINKGIEACKIDYSNNLMKLEGAIAGFESCRTFETIEEIESWQLIATQYRIDARKNKHDYYWFFRTFEVEVSFVRSRMKNLMNSIR